MDRYREFEIQYLPHGDISALKDEIKALLPQYHFALKYGLTEENSIRLMHDSFNFVDANKTKAIIEFFEDSGKTKVRITDNRTESMKFNLIIAVILSLLFIAFMVWICPPLVAIFAVYMVTIFWISIAVLLFILKNTGAGFDKKFEDDFDGLCSAVERISTKK